MSLAVRGACIDSGTLFRALLSGLLFFLSFPKFGTGLLAWIAFVPLFCALQQKRPSQGFLIGFITGFSGYIGIIYWIVHVVVNYGYLPLPVGIAVMLLLAAYLALYIALFAYLQRGIDKHFYVIFRTNNFLYLVPVRLKGRDKSREYNNP